MQKSVSLCLARAARNCEVARRFAPTQEVRTSVFAFEDWRFRIANGGVLSIPANERGVARVSV